MAIISALIEGYRVTVNGVDCSAALNDPQWFNLKEEKISTSGRFLKTGTIVLLPVLSGFAANFFDPRMNGAQWMRGNSVLIEIQFSGTFQTLFTGFILTPPATPSRTEGRLTVEIGCQLAYKNRDVLAGDRAGVKLGISKTRTEIITSIAEGMEWQGALSVAIPEYPINYPIPLTRGTLVDQASAIAASALYGLDVDRLGVLRASKFSIQPASYLLEFSDADSFLEPEDGSEDPAGKVHAIAVGRDVDPNGISNKFVDEEVGLLSNISQFGPNGFIGRAEVTGVRKRTTLCEQWSPDFKQLVTTQTIELPFVSYLSTPPTVELQLRDVVIETKVFSPEIDGKLATTTTDTTQTRRDAGINVLNATDAEENARITVARTVENWTYDGEVPAVHDTEFYGLRTRSFNGFTTEIDENVLNRVERVTWQRLAGDRWVRRESTYVPSETTPGELEDTGEVRTQIGEKYRPGEPERHIPTDSSEAIDYLGVACFGGISKPDDEPAIYEFEYGHSIEQAEALAELHGAILIGRHRTWRAKVPLTEEWLNYQPGAAVKVTLPSGEIIAALIDGPSINLSEAQGIVGFSLIDLGTVGSVAIVRPVGQVLDGSQTTPTDPTPTTVPITPPYERVSTAEAVVTAIADGSIIVNNVQPTGAVAEVTAIADGGSPAGDAGTVAEVTAIADGGVSGVVSAPLPISQGGTGATTLAGARAALGFGGIASGDLTGNYPNPAIAAGAVTYAKLQQIAAGVLLGNSQAAPGEVEEITIGDNLTLAAGVLSATGGSGGSGSSGSGSSVLESDTTGAQSHWIKFPGSAGETMLLQWGVGASASGIVSINFDEDFANTDYRLAGTVRTGGPGTGDRTFHFNNTDKTVSGATGAVSANGGTSGASVEWIAVGVAASATGGIGGGAGGGAWAYVDTQTATGTETLLTFSGLSGNDFYAVINWGQASTASSAYLHLYVNGDTTPGNYVSSEFFVDGGTLGDSQASFPRAGFINSGAAQGGSSSWVNIKRDALGDRVAFRSLSYYQASGGGSGLNAYENSVGHSVSSDTDITEISIGLSTNGAFAAGSEIILYQLTTNGGGAAPEVETLTADAPSVSFTGLTGSLYRLTGTFAKSVDGYLLLSVDGDTTDANYTRQRFTVEGSARSAAQGSDRRMAYADASASGQFTCLLAKGPDGRFTADSQASYIELPSTTQIFRRALFHGVTAMATIEIAAEAGDILAGSTFVLEELG